MAEPFTNADKIHLVADLNLGRGNVGIGVLGVDELFTAFLWATGHPEQPQLKFLTIWLGLRTTDLHSSHNSLRQLLTIVRARQCSLDAATEPDNSMQTHVAWFTKTPATPASVALALRHLNTHVVLRTAPDTIDAYHATHFGAHLAHANMIEPARLRAANAILCGSVHCHAGWQYQWLRTHDMFKGVPRVFYETRNRDCLVVDWQHPDGTWSFQGVWLIHSDTSMMTVFLQPTGKSAAEALAFLPAIWGDVGKYTRVERRRVLMPEFLIDTKLDLKTQLEGQAAFATAFDTPLDRIGQNVHLSHMELHTTFRFCDPRGVTELEPGSDTWPAQIFSEPFIVVTVHSQTLPDGIQPLPTNLLFVGKVVD